MEIEISTSWQLEIPVGITSSQLVPVSIIQVANGVSIGHTRCCVYLRNVQHLFQLSNKFTPHYQKSSTEPFLECNGVKHLQYKLLGEFYSLL